MNPYRRNIVKNQSSSTEWKRWAKALLSGRILTLQLRRLRSRIDRDLFRVVCAISVLVVAWLTLSFVLFHGSRGDQKTDQERGGNFCKGHSQQFFQYVKINKNSCEVMCADSNGEEHQFYWKGCEND